MRRNNIEPLYTTVVQTARLVWWMQGLTFTITGVHNLPRTGGAVIAINHTSFFDFVFAGRPAAIDQGLGRKVRFMAMKEVFDRKSTGPLMRGMGHIPVDRTNGTASFDLACQALKHGELVGIYPEGGISRSFELKEFKSGAARMAIAANVPIVPHIVWGAHRIWTKDYPRKLLHPKVHVSVAVGEPIPPTMPAPELTTTLRTHMQHLLHDVQRAYGPHPPGAHWVPHRLGGGAPSEEQAAQLDANDMATPLHAQPRP